MREKIPSEIVRLAPNDATYKDCGVSVVPTLINFFFGNNGSGKSTIGKAIKVDSGVSWRTGRSVSDYTIHVYNQEYITANLASYHNLPGVFTVNEVNVEIQRQVEAKYAEKKTAADAFRTATEDRKKKQEDLDQAFVTFQTECWDKTAEIRTAFRSTQTGKMQKKSFAEEVLAKSGKAKEYDVNALKRLYDVAYSADAKRYVEFTTIPDTSVLDTIVGREVLGESVVSSADTPFAQFVKAINATAWVQQGHSQYHGTASGKCPYCQQDLPTTFEEDIKACFDAQYQESVKTISDFLERYKAAANALFIPLQKTPAELYPGIDLTSYTDKLAAIRGVITTNIQAITDKKSDPSKVVTIEEVAPMLDDLVVIIESFNKLIRENNAVLDEKPGKQSECKTAVWEHIAFLLKDEVARYKTSKAALEKEMSDLVAEIAKQRTAEGEIARAIADLNKGYINTSATVDSVNMLLRDSGFQGFSIREKTDTPNVYEVVRPDGSIAENLSEGERNFIAFLYFYHQVKGSENADGDQKDKIVVIDDPVSSMDSSSLFIVSSLVREMIEVCANNAVGGDPVATGRYIKQIFILTHNAYFHREITYNRVRDYQFVNFYLITKVDNKSSIRSCVKKNLEKQTEKINYNPVQNSYAALWEEYKVVDTPIPLMNVIRRILEYYFLQLCGYDGATLRQRILKDNKEKFITKDESGNENYTQYQMASAMLSYISANSVGINDGINFVDDCVDIERTKETFKMVFTLMNQEQHYEMMMGSN